MCSVFQSMVADKKEDAGLFGWKNWTIPEHPSNRSNVTPRPGVNTHFIISRGGGVAPTSNKNSLFKFVN